MEVQGPSTSAAFSCFARSVSNRGRIRSRSSGTSAPVECLQLSLLHHSYGLQEPRTVLLFRIFFFVDSGFLLLKISQEFIWKWEKKISHLPVYSQTSIITICWARQKSRRVQARSAPGAAGTKLGCASAESWHGGQSCSLGLRKLDDEMVVWQGCQCLLLRRNVFNWEIGKVKAFTFQSMWSYTIVITWGNIGGVDEVWGGIPGSVELYHGKKKKTIKNLWNRLIL